MDFDSMDPRDVELSALAAIYPEMQRVVDHDPYTVTLDIPVSPPNPVPTLFSAAAQGTSPLGEVGSTQRATSKRPGPTCNGKPSSSKAGATARAAGSGPRPAEPVVPEAADELHELAHLPPIRIEMAFGPAYPAEEPLRASISTDPSWLPVSVARQLEKDSARLWEELGRDIVGYALIDHIRQAAETVFGLVDQTTGVLEVDARHKIAMLDHDIKAQRAAFERMNFDCGVCLDPKNGSVCHRMLDCGHVFCIQCLQDFYGNVISEGDVAAVRCLAPGCAKDREKAAKASLSGTRPGKKSAKKPRTFISPSELLQIPLQPDVVKRYVDLKYKTQLEADKNTIYCPRTWCSGAARSKRHKKPDGVELYELDDDGDDDDGDDNNQEGKGLDTADTNGRADGLRPALKDSRIAGRRSKGKGRQSTDQEELLAICTDCSFAFCRRCTQSWHGQFVLCSAPRQSDELTAEEKASEEYFKLHTTPCPTCDAPSQKTSGCNHMVCSRCQTHFCYLCAAWLDPGNPYRHYNQLPDGKATSCYMRLWELERGDGDDVGLGFGEVVDDDGDGGEDDGGDGDDGQGGHGQEVWPWVPDRAPANAAPGPAQIIPERAQANIQNPPPDRHRAHGRNRDRIDRGPDQQPVVMPINGVAAHDPHALPARAMIQGPRNLEPRRHDGAARERRGGPAAPRPRDRPRNGPRDGLGAARRQPPARAGQDGGGDVGIDAYHAAWVRRFVELALNDEEDQFDDDDDDQDDDDELF